MKEGDFYRNRNQVQSTVNLLRITANFARRTDICTDTFSFSTIINTDILIFQKNRAKDNKNIF